MSFSQEKSLYLSIADINNFKFVQHSRKSHPGFFAKKEKGDLAKGCIPLLFKIEDHFLEHGPGTFVNGILPDTRSESRESHTFYGELIAPVEAVLRR
jgi:hypothetical protein